MDPWTFLNPTIVTKKKSYGTFIAAKNLFILEPIQNLRLRSAVFAIFCNGYKTENKKS